MRVDGIHSSSTHASNVSHLGPVDPTRVFEVGSVLRELEADCLHQQHMSHVWHRNELESRPPGVVRTVLEGLVVIVRSSSLFFSVNGLLHHLHERVFLSTFLPHSSQLFVGHSCSDLSFFSLPLPASAFLGCNHFIGVETRHLFCEFSTELVSILEALVPGDLVINCLESVNISRLEEGVRVSIVEVMHLLSLQFDYLFSPTKELISVVVAAAQIVLVSSHLNEFFF
jgi:hypothetical protein